MSLLTPEAGAIALSIARKAVECALKGERYELQGPPPVFEERMGVFVTLSRRGELRGCIGIPYPVMPLKEALVEAAISAALCDPRFPPVTKRELPEIELEVTVLTPPERLECAPQERPRRIEVGRHGLIVKLGQRSGLLLPQVAVEYGWGEEKFLDHTCLKAGLEPGCWRSPRVEVSRFEGQIFSERKE